MTDLMPVTIEVVRQCHFVAKPCGLCGLPKSNRAHTPKRTATCPWRRQNGCATCGRAKGDAAHFGEPPSFNLFATSGAPAGVMMASAKKAWQAILLDRLRATDLPTGLGRVVVEGEAVFPRPAKRDQGNFRVVVEKALGDALEEGGYLEDDTWARYEFGGLAQRIVPDVSATRLTIFPMPRPTPTVVPDQMELR